MGHHRHGSTYIRTQTSRETTLRFFSCSFAADSWFYVSLNSNVKGIFHLLTETHEQIRPGLVGRRKTKPQTHSPDTKHLIEMLYCDSLGKVLLLFMMSAFNNLLKEKKISSCPQAFFHSWRRYTSFAGTGSKQCIFFSCLLMLIAWRLTRVLNTICLTTRAGLNLISG